jgi:hypothetical protein
VAYGTPESPRPYISVVGREGGNYMLSSPLLLCEDERFALVHDFVDVAIAAQLSHILQRTFESVRQLYSLKDAPDNPHPVIPTDLGLDEVIGRSVDGRNVPALMLETCALASRIFFRTLKYTTSFNDCINEADMIALYDNLRFIGLRSWSGLPYVYLWM